MRTVTAIRTGRASGTILIVGHGGTNQMIVRTLPDLSTQQAQSFEQANDDLYLIELGRGSPARLWKLIDLPPTPPGPGPDSPQQ
jgi:broad specificity phosphatase PhoE